MRVLIIGAGAVGVAIAVSLKNQGAEVDMIARHNTGEYIREHGAGRTGIYGDVQLGPGAIGIYEDYQEIENEYDYIIVSAKTLANPQIAESLNDNRRIMSKDCRIIIFQNGWGIAEEYTRYFNKEQVFNSGISIGFERVTPGLSKVTVETAPMMMGSLFGCSTECIRPIEDALNKGGIPAEISETFTKAMWSKMLFNTTLNPLGAILNVPYGALAESESAKLIMTRLITETYQVMEAAGYSTFWGSAGEYAEEFYSHLIPAAARHRSSTLQDIEKGKKTEIDTLTGSIIKLAGKYDVNVPTHEMIYLMIRGIEENRHLT